MTQQKNQSYSISFSCTITFTSRVDGKEGYTLLFPDDSFFQNKGANSLIPSLFYFRSFLPENQRQICLSVVFSSH